MRASPPHYEDQPSSPWGCIILCVLRWFLTMRTSPPHHEDQPSSPWGPALLTMRSSPHHPMLFIWYFVGKTLTNGKTLEWALLHECIDKAITRAETLGEVAAAAGMAAVAAEDDAMLWVPMPLAMEEQSRRNRAIYRRIHRKKKIHKGILYEFYLSWNKYDIWYSG